MDGRTRGGRDTGGALLVRVLDGPQTGVRLMPTPSGRARMDATTNRFANRRLPLKMPTRRAGSSSSTSPCE
jgi:hypothetical protein